MYRSDIVNYFERKIKYEELTTLLELELREYKYALETQGKSARITYDGDKDEFKVTASYFRVLLEDYINKDVDEQAIDYIVNALLISEYTLFESELIREGFEALADPELNGKLSIESAKIMLDTIKGE
jgi:hypothetical protein